MSAQPNEITSPALLLSLTKYLRLTNYLAAAQLYLKSNFLLEEELKKEHIKERVLGHWGTVPGLNFIYANANILIQRHHQEAMMIFGPGHGYPSLLANLYVEGTLGDFYPEYKWSKEAFGKVIHNFSWPRCFPSHSNPETPGVILEGGELGYSLGSAFGAAFDNPDLLVICVVGDGEAETATTATSWHSNKFLNPRTSGAVLPIVHINKYKISGPTVYGTMGDDELKNLFEGYGYDPIIVEGDFLYEPMLYAMEESYQKIKEIQKDARENGKIDKPKWPVILFKSKKGWTGPKENHGLMIEDSFRSHGVPLENVLTDDGEFQILKNWLESYHVRELLTQNCEPIDEIKELIPDPDLKMGHNRYANCDMVAPLDLPELKDYELPIEKPGKGQAADMIVLSKYLAEVVKRNPASFRLMSPDESVSNRLTSMFDVTERAFMWPTPPGSEKIGPDGRVMEVLSENLLMTWMQGYILTGRHALFVTYEAFMMITASMVDQYLKFLHQKDLIHWRKPVPSMNIILTSSSWRQEHNGISHQNPGFISSLLNNNSSHVDIHFPVDANMLLATLEECLFSRDKVNVIIAGKRDMPQYLSVSDSQFQMKTGIGIWDGATEGALDPDLVYAATGDYMTLESLAALKILKQMAPEIKTRFVSVSELSNFNIGDLTMPGKTSLAEFEKYFTADKPVIYSYHGYPEDIKQLLWGNTHAGRIRLHGYTERGTTTTPFDMLVLNKVSRFQLALEGAAHYLEGHPEFKDTYKKIEMTLRTTLAKHEVYIQAYGKDIPEVENFKLVE
jgi:xylulose-5-phosphate/fructose-6-phosphate phosphoketolase